MSSNFAEQLKKRTDEYTRRMGPALDELAKIAANYEPPNQQDGPAAKLREIRAHLQNDTFRVIVIGRFKNGKSTFLNALLGKLTHPTPELPQGGAPLPTSDLPCTPTLTSIVYQDQPSVRLQRKDNKSWEEKSLSWYLRQARINYDPEEHKRAFANVLQFQLGFPVELCKAGVVLVDTPGTDEDPDRNAITDEALFESDAAIVLYRSDVLAGMTDLAYVKTMIGIGLQRYFSIVNLWDARPIDEQLKGFTWDKLVTRLKGGAHYAGQNLESEEEIYFIDAQSALQGKLTDDPRLLDRSGLAHFEQRLQTFLDKDRRAVHVERFVKGAMSQALDVAERIAKRIPLLEVEQQQFQARYQEILPQLEQIRARGRRLSQIFARHRRDCQLELQDSFEQLFLQIRQDLPAELKSWQIPSLHTGNMWQKAVANALAPFQKNKLAKEAMEKALEIVKQKVTVWQQAPASESGANQIMSRAVERLIEEVSQEVAAIERACDQVTFHLGWDPQQIQLTVKGPHWVERASAAGLAVLLSGSPDYILTGGVGGFKGLGRDVAGRLAVVIPLLLLHAPLFPVVIPVSMIAGLVNTILWGSKALEKEIKDKAVQMLVYGDPKSGTEGVLRAEPERARPYLAKLVDEVFGKIEAGVSQEVDRLIKGEEQNIQASLQDSARNAEEKEKLKTQMKSHLEAIAHSCTALEDALNAVKQI